MKNFLNNRRKAFTLSEVLITIGIIGVVAAITIPNLIVNHRERANITKLKTVYSTITQAYTRAVTEFGTPEHWSLEAQNSTAGAANISQILSPYFNVTENCSTNGGCWYNGNILGLNKVSSGTNYSTNSAYSTFSTVDGVQFAFNVENPECKGVFGDSRALENVCATFTVDVNGKKFPNQYGYDIFKFYITKYGIQPYGHSSDTTNSFDNTCANQGSGLGCAAWAILKANVDYIHCGGLSWEGKSRCKMIDTTNYNSGL